MINDDKIKNNDIPLEVSSNFSERIFDIAGLNFYGVSSNEEKEELIRKIIEKRNLIYKQIQEDDKLNISK